MNNQQLILRINRSLARAAHDALYEFYRMTVPFPAWESVSDEHKEALRTVAIKFRLTGDPGDCKGFIGLRADGHLARESIIAAMRSVLSGFEREAA